MAQKLLGYKAPPSLAIAAGATAPNPGFVGVQAWSTTLGALVTWDGVSWNAAASGSGSGSGAVNLTGPITSVGAATAIASQSGTGTTFAMSVAPVFTGGVRINTGRLSGSYGPVATISNFAAGDGTLAAITTGSDNVAVGLSAIQNNTTGSANIGVGVYTLNQNTAGNNNVAIGAYVLQGNTTGSNNIAVGGYALQNNGTGYNNTALGMYALNQNTAGINNVAIGAYALQANTTGAINAAIGLSALYRNTTGNFNVATGPYALHSNTTGSSNVATGPYALYSNTTGSSNVSMGENALNSNTTGNNNVAIGQNALQNNTGDNNTVVGYLAGTSSLLTGSNNTIIGANASVLDSALSNNIILANGTGAIKAQHDGTNWTFTGAINGTGTGLTGTAAGLTAGTVTTNANLTGLVTSVGNATAIADGALSIAKTVGLQAALFSRVVSSISVATTAAAAPSTDYVYLVSGVTTLTLPTAAGNSNRYSVKNTGVNAVTIVATAAQTIDGSTTASLPVQYTSLDLISDGSNWNVL